MVLAPIGFSVLFLSCTRLAYMLWHYERVAATGQAGFILLQGLRFDLVLMALLMIVPVSLAPLFLTHTRLFRVWRPMMLGYATFCFVFICFMELATPSFINEYDSRPNYLFIEYLQHYREVGATLLLAYPQQLLAGGLFVPMLGWLHLQAHKRLLVWHRPLHWATALLLVPLLFSGLLMAARSTLDHRPVNPATVAVTSDHLVNELPLSSAYTLLYAIYQSRYDEAGGRPYGDLPAEKVIEVVRRESHISPMRFVSTRYPTWHRQQSTREQKKPLNLVIILEESLGAEFVGKLGGLPLTPNIDRLAEEGIWFDQLYATGTRSVRGIEAVTTGFLPTPSVSIVKQNKAQHGFFTLAGYLKQYGYETGFVYGGESHFDNMRGFFMGNGFDYVIDQADYEDAVFTGSWGVSDEDLLNKADAQFRSRADDQPFFALVFTSSNHSPFEYPEKRIEQYDAEVHTVNNAVKYADYALGKFFETAKLSPYWHNTVFVVIADHNSRVYGDSLVPIHRFRIPGLILGGTIEPDVIEVQASQIDIPPTLLSLLGISGVHPMIGRDLTVPANRFGPGRSIMQFYDTQAYREGDDVVVLRTDMPPLFMTYKDNVLIEAQQAKQSLLEKALAHSLFAQLAYRDRLYPQQIAQ